MSHLLVVENDRGFREAWVELLRSFGNHVIAIADVDNQRPEDFHGHCNLALVDRRARDDQDEFDASGQDFAIRLCALGTPSVLVTSFRPKDAALFELLRTGSVTGVADKSIDMSELANCIGEFNLSHRFPNCVTRFRWKDRVEDGFAREDWEVVKKGVHNSDASPEQFAVLFRSLVPPCAIRVELEPIPPGHGGAALFHARVWSGDGPLIEEVAIKYGERTAIHSEALRYDRHVGPLPDGVAAHLRWRKESGALGALAYSWVGDSIEDGIPFGPIGGKSASLTWRRRRTAIERLFSVSLDPWYNVYRSTSAPIQRQTLYDYYSGKDGYFDHVPFADDVLPNDLPSQVTSDGDYWDFGTFGRMLNPARWLSTGSGSKMSFFKYSPCHGDLHVKNIFVLPDDSPRLIDFGETSMGHLFRDFTALEASIRLTCCNTLDLNLLRRADDLTSVVSSLGEHIDSRGLGNSDADLRETLRATMQIRRAALDAAGSHSDGPEIAGYLFALVARMLRYALGIADEVSSSETSVEKKARVWHALYAAASATQQAERLASNGTRGVG